MPFPIALMGAAALVGLSMADVAVVSVATVVVGGVTYYSYGAYQEAQQKKNAAAQDKLVTACINRLAGDLDTRMASTVGGQLENIVDRKIAENNQLIFTRMDRGLEQILARLPQAAPMAQAA